MSTEDPDPYFNALMLSRQVMSWSVATRLQLDRWEPLVARNIWVSLSKEKELPGNLIWQAQFEHHWLLVACGHLLRALDLAANPIAVEPSLKADLIAGRDLHEHWIDNMPVFNVTPRQKKPPRASGKGFAKRNPGRSPYGWLGWSSKVGPKVLPEVPASTVHELLDAAEEWAVSVSPDFADFRLPRAESPWMGPDAGPDRWWPHQVSM